MDVLSPTVPGSPRGLVLGGGSSKDPDPSQTWATYLGTRYLPCPSATCIKVGLNSSCILSIFHQKRKTLFSTTAHDFDDCTFVVVYYVVSGNKNPPESCPDRFATSRRPRGSLHARHPHDTSSSDNTFRERPCAPSSALTPFKSGFALRNVWTQRQDVLKFRAHRFRCSPF